MTAEHAVSRFAEKAPGGPGQVKVRTVEVRCDEAGLARYGRLVEVRHVMVWTGRQGGVCHGFSRKGSEWQAWRVQAPKGTASLGAAGELGRVPVCYGLVR